MWKLETLSGTEKKAIPHMMKERELVSESQFTRCMRSGFTFPANKLVTLILGIMIK